MAFTFNTLYLDCLSEEVLLMIFQYITDLKDLFTLRLLSERIAAVAQDMSVAHTVICSRHYWLKTGMLKMYIEPILNKMHTLDLNYCYWINLEELTCLLRCTNLRSLHLMQVKIDEVSLCKMLSQLPHLTSLSISICDIEKFNQKVNGCKAVQECLSRIRKLSIHFWHHKKYKQDNCEQLVRFSSGSSFVDHFHSLEELYVYGSADNSRCFPLYYFTPLVKNVNSLKNMRVMSLNKSYDEASTILFYSLLRSVCKVGVQLSTLLQPTYDCNLEWKESDYLDTMADMNTLVHLDISGSQQKIYNGIFNFTSATHLQYLNLSGNNTVDSESLLFLSRCCPHLVSINLHSCPSIFLRHALGYLGRDFNNDSLVKDLTGFQSLLVQCVKLVHLNISGYHIHLTDLNSPSFSSITALLSLKPNLISLSLSHCCLYTGDNCPSSDLRDPKFSTRCSSCYLPVIDDSGSPKCTYKATSEKFDLQKLTRATPEMEHFELYAAYHQSTFNHPSGLLRHPRNVSQCLSAVIVPNDDLRYVGLWNKLKTLRLTGLKGDKLADFFTSIDGGCVSLESLSISSTCSTKVRKLKRLPCFPKLKDFRLEHPYFPVNEEMLSSIAQWPKLERACIISHIENIDSFAIKQLLTNVPRLVNFQLFSHASERKCFNLMAYISQKLSQSRPDLSVCICNLRTVDLELMITEHLPDIHIEEMTLLRSRVAASPRE
ncbi:F-box/LRR-repeat protein 18 [Biomphalaria pfeifferi]|uniref:F-box/LRR-repeat protein 18 n=1 Tax=Biomphalaria pfeifferi TaxID=112525 RepID=A0AAD8BAR7_BIOPF|nr:F-box/LRR-repeat protein 18 [Biomphalaria pfeifferi]